MNRDDIALKPGFLPGGAGRPVQAAAAPVTCTIPCSQCPWVDFHDYDQCGLTSSAQCHGLVPLPPVHRLPYAYSRRITMS
jgi:hypothetical protein